MIVPDRHGSGTNALLLTPPDVIDAELRPGQPRAPRASWHARPEPRSAIAEVASLLLDVDTAEDLEVLAHGLAGAPRERALHTRNAMSSMRRT